MDRVSKFPQNKVPNLNLSAVQNDSTPDALSNKNLSHRLLAISSCAEQNQLTTVFCVKTAEQANEVVKELKKFQAELQEKFKIARFAQDILGMRADVLFEIIELQEESEHPLREAICIYEIKRTLLELECVLITQIHWPVDKWSKRLHNKFVIGGAEMRQCLSINDESDDMPVLTPRGQDLLDLLVVEYSSCPQSAQNLIEERHRSNYRQQGSLLSEKEEQFREHVKSLGLPVVDPLKK